MTHRTATYTILAALSLILAGCDKTTENIWNSQEKTIENFVNASLAQTEGAYAVYNGGSVRVTVSPVEGDSLTTGGLVSFYYAGYTLSGTTLNPSNLFWTNNRSIATAAGREVSDPSVYAIETVTLGSDALTPGLTAGMKGVKAGGEYYILFSGKYGFGKRAVGTISAKSPLVYHIWVESISNE